MDIVSGAGFLAGGAWASGINLYLTIAGLGIAGKTGIIELPGDLDILTHPLVIAAALLVFAIEFFADKVPFVDSAWDSIHTFIRPLGAAIMAYMASSGSGASVQIPAIIICGVISMDAHMAKATARLAINSSPEPFTNIAASFTEDISVLLVLWLVARHPVIAGILVVSFLVFSIFFFKLMFRFTGKVLSFFFRGRKNGNLET